jgi:hypothetical protein
MSATEMVRKNANLKDLQTGFAASRGSGAELNMNSASVICMTEDCNLA